MGRPDNRPSVNTQPAMAYKPDVGQDREHGEPPSLKNFIRAFGVRWFVAMSGPLSVPLAGLAFWVESKTAKIGFGITALICAIFALYWIWRVERQRVLDLEARLGELMLSRAVLEVRLEQCEPYLRRHEHQIYWRFALHNRGSAAADNVHVSLTAIRPLPSNAVGLLDFPLSTNSLDARINPNEDGVFPIFTAYPDTQGEQPSTRWRVDALGRGVNYVPSVFFENGGQWEMDYHVSAANADEFAFALLVHAKSDCITVSRKP
jgi:hypothetical protein